MLVVRDLRLLSLSMSGRALAAFTDAKIFNCMLMSWRLLAVLSRVSLSSALRASLAKF